MPPHALGLRTMLPRDPHQPHRAASPLELFFDLVFVVAVSISSTQLHHALSENHVGTGVGAYLMVFFAIWWAWMNFTWFASAFDTDDWLYRLLTIVQMAGVLVLAAGTPAAMNDFDFTVVTLGYVIMRLALVAQWLRAANARHELRRTAARYALGITLVQVLWIARLWLPESLGLASFLLLAVVEISVPAIAERTRATPWHPGHIAERYGLFTLILLGESILASATAIIDGLEHAEVIAPLLLIAATGLILAAGMWWTYFSVEHDHLVDTLPRSLRFGYGHYLLFASAGAFSAGIEVAIDVSTHQSELDAVTAAATLTIPVALFVLSTWWITLRESLAPARSGAIVALAALIAVAAFVPWTLIAAAMLMVAIVAVLPTRPPSVPEEGTDHGGPRTSAGDARGPVEPKS